MGVTVKSSSQHTPGRLWHTPTSKAALYWFVFAIIYCAIFYLLYFVLFKAPIFTGPWFDKVFRVGVMSYLMILAVAAYSLRIRFIRSLPFKAQNWVWMHMWVGIASVLLASLHADYRFVLHGYCSNLSCITDHYAGMPALYSLIFIGVSGVIGRLLDLWQTRIIARDASTNGVGIAKTINVRLLELEYIIERYCAGKSEPFKQYCLLALASMGKLPHNVPALAPHEQADFQYAYETLKQHARLAQSLNKQNRARLIFRVWRYVHTIFVPLALGIISYHGIMELLMNVFHLFR